MTATRIEGRGWVGVIHSDDVDELGRNADVVQELFDQRREQLIVLTRTDCRASVTARYSAARSVCMPRWWEPSAEPQGAEWYLRRWIDEAGANLRPVRAVGLPSAEPRTTRAQSAWQWVIPHRGDLRMLGRCLSAVQQVRAPNDRVTVCLDQPITVECRALVRVFDEVGFFTLSKTPCGPYVARNLLGGLGLGDVLLFQDSDDLPALGRREGLENELLSSGADVVGSGEIRIDLTRGATSVVDYPADVNAALSVRCGFPQLHPTTCITAVAFRKSGGFSTDLTFGGDTQFLLRNFFALRFRNTQLPYYVRVVRPDSLSTSNATGLGTANRTQVETAWKRDFAQAMEAAHVCATSSLAIHHRADLESITLVPL